MPEGQEKPQPEVKTQGTQISPDILSSLGLNDKDVKEFDKAEIERKITIERQRNNGSGAYKEGKYGERHGGGFKDFGVVFQNNRWRPIVIGENISAKDVPDKIFADWAKGKENGYYREDPDHSEDQIRAWLEGFGNGALEANDWQAALTAFDVATDGNVQGNEKLMAKLREITAGDKTTGVEIAKTMQERVIRRTSQPAAQQPSPSVTS